MRVARVSQMGQSPVVVAARCTVGSRPFRIRLEIYLSSLTKKPLSLGQPPPHCTFLSANALKRTRAEFLKPRSCSRRGFFCRSSISSRSFLRIGHFSFQRTSSFETLASSALGVLFELKIRRRIICSTRKRPEHGLIFPPAEMVFEGAPSVFPFRGGCGADMYIRTPKLYRASGAHWVTERRRRSWRRRGSKYAIWNGSWRRAKRTGREARGFIGRPVQRRRDCI